MFYIKPHGDIKYLMYMALLFWIRVFLKSKNQNLIHTSNQLFDLKPPFGSVQIVDDALEVWSGAA